jgi:hypothetical protein
MEKERQAMEKLNLKVEEFDQKFLEEYKDEEPQESPVPEDNVDDEESDDF